MNGKWGHDFDEESGLGGWRWMPPNLYFYINMCIITLEDEIKGEITAPPKLRDIDWCIFTGLAVADGFSGFEGDEEYSCHDVLRKVNSDEEELTHKEKKLLHRDDLQLRKKDGSFKIYQNPTEYLKKTFDQPLGKPIYKNENKNFMILSSRGVGKMLKAEEKVRVEGGWKTMEDIKVGDKVYGRDGKLANVIWKSFKQKDLKMYKIKLRDGREIEACEDHKWLVFDKVEYRGKKHKVSDGYVVKTTKELYSNYYYYRKPYKFSKDKTKKPKEFRYAIPLNKCLDLPEKELPLDPYFLACWLGDGNSHNAAITTIDEPIKKMVYDKAKEYGCKVTVNYNKSKTCNTYVISVGNTAGLNRGVHKNPVTNILRELNVLNNKHIPKIYLESSREQRLQLLRGLMDTDGTASGRCIEFYSKNKRLAEDVCELSRSLGHHTQIKTKESKLNGVSYGDSYRVVIKTKDKIFNLERKHEVHKKTHVEEGKPFYGRYEKSVITEITPTENADGYCIQVDNEDNTFITKDYIVTHNSFSLAGDLCHEFVTAGSKDVADFLEEVNESTIIVGSAELAKSTELLEKFRVMYDYLRTDIGAYTDGDYNEEGIFWRPTSGSILSSSKTPLSRRVKLKGGVGYTGANVNLVHASYAKGFGGVGYRARKIVTEEVGLLESVQKLHSLNDASQKRQTKFGSSIYIGTGGDFKRIRESQEMFTNPIAFNIVPYDDIFSGTGKEIGLFIPGYYANNLYRDDKGNLDLQAAFEDAVTERVKMRESSIAAYSRHILNYPIVPSEMFMSALGNPFDLVRIEDRLNFLKGGAWKKRAKIGDIYYLDDKKQHVRFQRDLRGVKTPIFEYRKIEDHEDKRGAFVIYEEPEENKPALNSRDPLYMVFYDSVMNEGDGSSLAVATVFKKSLGYDNKKINYNIVAEWVGREKTQDENHERAFKLANLYNARIFAEINLKDIKRYARMTNRYKYLEKKPSLALGEMGFTQKKAYDVGLRVDKGMKNTLEMYLAELTELEVKKEEYYNEGTKEIEIEVETFIDNCWSIRFLEECKFYNRDDNFDYISAMMLLSLWIREQKLKPVERYDKEKQGNKIQAMFDMVQSEYESSSENPAFNY